MENYQIFTLVILGLFVIYQVVGRKFLQDRRVLTDKQLALIDYACERGVKYAEQLYLTDQEVDRKKISIEFAMDIIKTAGIIPEMYLDIVRGIIESYVLELPPTSEQLKINES